MFKARTAEANTNQEEKQGEHKQKMLSLAKVPQETTQCEAALEEARQDAAVPESKVAASPKAQDPGESKAEADRAASVNVDLAASKKTKPRNAAGIGTHNYLDSSDNDDSDDSDDSEVPI